MSRRELPPLSIVTALAVVALLWLCAGMVGCASPADGQKPEREVHRDISKHISEVEIDGEKYLVVASPQGIGICPKVKPAEGND